MNMMRNNKQVLLLVAFFLCCFNGASAHHAATDVLDADTWLLIDTLLADTPHATMTLDDLGTVTDETVLEVLTFMLASTDQVEIDAFYAELVIIAESTTYTYTIEYMINYETNMTTFTLTFYA